MLAEASHTFENIGYQYPLASVFCCMAYIALFSLQIFLEKCSTSTDSNMEYNMVDIDSNTQADFAVAQEPEQSPHHHHDRLPAITLFIALVIHSFFEGAALGAQTDDAALVVIFVAIACHKGVESLALGNSSTLPSFVSSFFLLPSCFFFLLLLFLFLFLFFSFSFSFSFFFFHFFFSDSFYIFFFLLLFLFFFSFSSPFFLFFLLFFLTVNLNKSTNNLC